MKRCISIATMLFMSVSLAQAQSTTASTSAPIVDPQLWTEMTAVDAKASRIADLTADFEQRKFTPLLKKPLVSTGRVLGKGAGTMWITEKPEPTRMLVDASEIRIHYPRQAVLEIYPIQGQLGALAASPLPRLDVLKRFFSFERIAASSLDPGKDDAKCLALRMTPTDPTLREHVEEVKVLLDRGSGFILRAENTDADGERTVLTFANVRIDAGVTNDAMRLDVPPGTKESRSLGGLGPPPQRREKREQGGAR